MLIIIDIQERAGREGEGRGLQLIVLVRKGGMRRICVGKCKLTGKQLNAGQRREAAERQGKKERERWRERDREKEIERGGVTGGREKGTVNNWVIIVEHLKKPKIE